MAKTKPKKKKKKSAPPKKDHLSKFGVLKSDFVTILLNAIPAAESGGQLWGDDFADPDNKQLIGEDIASAFRSMFMRLELRPRPAPDPGTPGSATKLLATLMTDNNWPENPDLRCPKSWGQETFRRYEIACAINILIRVYNQHGPGGPPQWPPERPK